MYVISIIIIAVLILILVVLISAGVSGANHRKEQREILDKALVAIKNFTPTKVIRSEHPFIYYLGVDDKRQEIFCYSDSKGVRFKYQDIVTAEIVVDGKVIVTKKSASLGGALVGGAVAGGLGAVIGGSNMGSSTSTQQVTTIKVHILLRNAKVDSFDIICHNAVPIETISELYETTIANARAMFDILRLAMDKAKPVSHISRSENLNSKSQIEELKELADLKKQGMITEEEFVAMKAKIINK